MLPHDISVIIPTRNEADNVAAAIRSASDCGATEIIVADAGSSDDTVQQAKEARASKIVRSLPGRGTQQNAGVAVATRDWLLFLHADIRLHPDCLSQICDAVADADETLVWGAFSQRIQSSRLIYRAIEWGNAMRVRGRRMAFGDQAIFVRSDVFRRIGGFPDIPLMEDVRLSARLRKQSRPLLLAGPIFVDARRWEEYGVVRQTLKNWSIQLSHTRGVSPEELYKRYR